MATENKKNILLAGFIGMATFVVVVSSCANDTGSSTAEHPSTIPDSTVTQATEATAPATTKKRKGVASAAVSNDNSGSVKIQKDKDGVYSRAETMPEYPGGEPALSKFVENNITYPQNAVDQNTEGTVNVSFVVDEKGKVMNPVATGKTAGGGLDEEAVKIVKQMPAWKPGTVKGKAVKTRLLLPVTFKLSDV